MRNFDKVMAFLASSCGGGTIAALSAPGIMPKWVAIVLTMVGLGAAGVMKLSATDKVVGS